MKSICVRVAASRSSPTRGYSMACGTSAGRAPRCGGVAQRHRHPPVRQALHALAMHVAHAAAQRLCGLQGAFANPVPVAHVEGHAQRHASAVGRIEESLQRGQRAGAHGLVVLDQQLNARLGELHLQAPERAVRGRTKVADRHLEPLRAQPGCGGNAAPKCGAVEPAAFGPEPLGARIHRGQAGQRRQLGLGVAQHFAAHLDRFGTRLQCHLRAPELTMPAHLGRSEGRQGNQKLERHQGTWWERQTRRRRTHASKAMHAAYLKPVS